MSGEHERYDAMLGALVLGEATVAERDSFHAHARICDACRGEAAHMAHTVAALRAAGTDDASGPSVRDAVVRRIESSRTRRTHATAVALAWSLAACVAVETGFATGFFAHVATAVAAGRP